MSDLLADRGTSVEREVAVRLVDTDVHLSPTPAELLEHIDERLVSRHMRSDLRRITGSGRSVYLPLFEGMREDSWGPDGEVPGSHPETVKRQLWGDARVDFGLMTPLINGVGADPALNLAILRAVNRWQAESWLREEQPRFFGAICVPVDDVAQAVREVEEWAGHPHMRQILVQPDGARPFGHSMYDSLWETAARHDLPVAIHFDESNRLQLGVTPTGRFETLIEFHSISHPLENAAHLTSWIASGIFSRFERFRVAFLEGGFLWHLPVIARMQRAWDDKSGLLPNASKSPLACVRDQVRFASQPLETAVKRSELAAYLRAAGADELLMFSSDYPHYDFDDPAFVLPALLNGDTRARILCENAREFYGLPATRPAGLYDNESSA